MLKSEKNLAAALPRQKTRTHIVLSQQEYLIPNPHLKTYHSHMDNVPEYKAGNTRSLVNEGYTFAAAAKLAHLVWNEPENPILGQVTVLDYNVVSALIESSPSLDAIPSKLAQLDSIIEESFSTPENTTPHHAESLLGFDFVRPLFEYSGIEDSSMDAPEWEDSKPYGLIMQLSGFQKGSNNGVTTHESPITDVTDFNREHLQALDSLADMVQTALPQMRLREIASLYAASQLAGKDVASVTQMAFESDSPQQLYGLIAAGIGMNGVINHPDELLDFALQKYGSDAVSSRMPLLSNGLDDDVYSSTGDRLPIDSKLSLQLNGGGRDDPFSNSAMHGDDAKEGFSAPYLPVLVESDEELGFYRNGRALDPLTLELVNKREL